MTEIPGEPETESVPESESASIVCDPLYIQTPGAAPPSSVTESVASPIGSVSDPVRPAPQAGVRSEREETAAKTHRGWKERQGKSLFIIAVSFLITIWVVQPSHYIFQNVTAAKPKRRNPGPLFFVSLFIPIGPWAQRIRFFLSIHRINASA